MYSNELVCKILKYIEENINNKITIQDLEKIFFYNRYYIMKLFKKEIGMSVIEYINSIRIYNSIISIRDTNFKLIYIAFKNGFYSLEYFSETFKTITGLNPRKFINYFKRSKNITEKEIFIINNKIIELYEISKIKENYLSKLKQKGVKNKKISIFK